MILISNHIYILSFIFLLYNISIKYILPIEFRINSMSDKCNIYYVVDILHLASLLLMICIHLLDFPIFVGVPPYAGEDQEKAKLRFGRVFPSIKYLLFMFIV